MDLLTDFFYHGKVLKQGRGVSVANDRPHFGCSSYTHSRYITEHAMPFIPAENTVRTAIEYLSTYGDTAANVQHYRFDGGAPAAADIDDLHDAIKDWLTTDWGNAASNQWQTDLITSTDLTVPDGIQVTSLFTQPGYLTSPALPSQDTIAVSMRTGLSGRSRRGRNYHVGLAENQVEGSRLLLAAATNIITAWFPLIAKVQAAGWTLVIASFQANKLPRTTALLTPVTDMILTDTVIDSMDTRKPKGA